jgi:hypothetical protein
VWLAYLPVSKSLRPCPTHVGQAQPAAHGPLAEKWLKLCSVFKPLAETGHHNSRTENLAAQLVDPGIAAQLDGRGQNLRVAVVAHLGSRFGYPPEFARDALGTGGTETRRIFGLQAYSLSDAPMPGRIVA